MNFFNFNKSDNNKVLLLIEPGGIGDYILIRPYFKFIKQSPKYKDFKVIYLSKDSYIDFVRAYDSEHFDLVIPYNNKELDKNKDYRKYLVKKLNKLNVDTIVNLRNIVIDNYPDWGVRRRLVKNIKAKYKIADVIKLRENKKHQRMLNTYTDIIYSDDKAIFELERRRLFFENLLKMNIPQQDTSLYCILDNIDKNTVLMSMSSLSEYRNYPIDKCVMMLKKLLSVTDYKFALLGTHNQSEDNQSIIDKVDRPDRVINLAGKTNITQLPDILKKCAFFIGVESGTVHIANSVGCKVICLSNGSFYQRFHPYPKTSAVTYVYPDWFKKSIKNNDLDFMDVYGGQQSWNLNDISVDDVLEAIIK